MKDTNIIYGFYVNNFSLEASIIELTDDAISTMVATSYKLFILKSF